MILLSLCLSLLLSCHLRKRVDPTSAENEWRLHWRCSDALALNICAWGNAGTQTGAVKGLHETVRRRIEVCAQARTPCDGICV